MPQKKFAWIYTTLIFVGLIIELIVWIVSVPAHREHTSVLSEYGEIYVYSRSQPIYVRTSAAGPYAFEVTLDERTETCGALWCEFTIPADGELHHITINSPGTVGVMMSSGNVFYLLSFR